MKQLEVNCISCTDTRIGGYYIPDLVLEPEQAELVREPGTYGCIYLKQYWHKLYRKLVASGKLQDHLLDIEDTIRDWLYRMMPEIAKVAGATGKLKIRD